MKAAEDKAKQTTTTTSTEAGPTESIDRDDFQKSISKPSNGRKKVKRGKKKVSKDREEPALKVQDTSTSTTTTSVAVVEEMEPLNPVEWTQVGNSKRSKETQAAKPTSSDGKTKHTAKEEVTAPKEVIPVVNSVWNGRQLIKNLRGETSTTTSTTTTSTSTTTTSTTTTTSSTTSTIAPTTSTEVIEVENVPEIQESTWISSENLPSIDTTFEQEDVPPRYAWFRHISDAWIRDLYCRAMYMGAWMQDMETLCDHIKQYAPDGDSHELASRLMRRIQHASRAVDQVRRGNEDLMVYAHYNFPQFVAPVSPYNYEPPTDGSYQSP